MTTLLLLSALAAAQATEAESLMAGRAQALLDGLLGPGRSHVTVSARQEARSLEMSSEYAAPVRPEMGLDARGRKPKTVPPVGTLRDREATRIDLGTRLTSIRAVVVIDRAVSDEKLAEAQRLLPVVLGLDAARGDALDLRRAGFARPWPRAPLIAAAAALAALAAFWGARRRRRLTALRLPDGTPALSGESFPEVRP